MWKNLSSQYPLSSGRILSLAVYSYSNYTFGKTAYDLLDIHLTDGNLSFVEHSLCSGGENQSWRLQKRDYFFRNGKLEHFSSVATPGLKPLEKSLSSELIAALEELIQEQPQLEQTVRSCLEEMK